MPAAVTGAGGHPHVVGTGAGWGHSSGPGLCPQCLLGWWGRGGLGLRAAMVPSLWLWPSPSISTHDSHEARGPRGLCRWGGRKAAPRSQGARLSGWSSALCPACLPAVGHWSRSRLERQSQPRQAQLRQRLQTGQPEGSHLTGWDPGSLKHVGRWRRVISGARPEPLSPRNACPWPAAWWAGRRKGSFLVRPVTTAGDRADMGAADEGDRPGALGTLRDMATAAVGGAGRLSEK